VLTWNFPEIRRERRSATIWQIIGEQLFTHLGPSTLLQGGRKFHKGIFSALDHTALALRPLHRQLTAFSRLEPHAARLSWRAAGAARRVDDGNIQKLFEASEPQRGDGDMRESSRRVGALNAMATRDEARAAR
jgi:hypothetical protein